MRTPSPLHSSVLTGLLLLAALVVPVMTSAQSFVSATGMIQGEHLARVTPLYDAVIRAASDTTAWLPIGTHNAALAAERPYAPGRFTAFVRMDTTGTGAAVSPTLTVRAQLALSDTTQPYEHADGTLDLAPSGAPLTTLDLGQVLPVSAYGGGYLRFIVAVDDSARVQLDLWRTH